MRSSSGPTKGAIVRWASDAPVPSLLAIVREDIGTRLPPVAERKPAPLLLGLKVLRRASEATEGEAEMALEWRGTTAPAIGLALVVGLVGLATAQRASAEGIAGGSTQVELSRGLFKALKKDGVQLSKVGAGTVAGRFATLPAAGGEIDFVSGSGSFVSDGGFRLRVGKRSAKVTRLTVETLRGTVRGAVDGTKLMLAAIPRTDFAREGFGVAIATSSLRLTPRASALLNRKLGLDAFRPGRPFASVSAGLQPDEVQVLSGGVRFEFDTGTVAKIKSLGFDVQPMESNGGLSDPAFSAPLLAGRIDPTMARTWGMAEGGFRITDPEKPGPTVDWWNLGLSFETGKLLTSGLAHTEFGQLAPGPPQPLASLNLANASVSVDPVYRTVTISGAKATLEPAAANYINQVFAIDRGKQPVLAAGDPLGAISLTMQGR